MNAERYQRVQEIFLEALGRSPAERVPFVKNSAAGDEGLVTDVLELLSHSDETDDGFSESSLERKRRLVTEAFSAGVRDDIEDDSPFSGKNRPSTIGPFAILDVLGEGGSGVVFRAQKKGTNDVVALKVLRSPDPTEKSLKRFRRECRILSELDHPAIVRVLENGLVPFDWEGEELALPYLALEFIDGQSAREWVETEKPDLAAIVALAGEVADALAYAHQRGVLHRDLKPSNVLVDRKGSPKVLDFGAAFMRSLESESETRLTAAGQIIGTMAYMAPEQVAGDSDLVDARSDVYALGALLLEMITEKPPHDLRDLSLMASIRRVREVDPVIPSKLGRRLRSLLSKALSRPPEKRFATMAALATELGRI